MLLALASLENMVFLYWPFDPLPHRHSPSYINIYLPYLPSPPLSPPSSFFSRSHYYPVKLFTVFCSLSHIVYSETEYENGVHVRYPLYHTE